MKTIPVVCLLFWVAACSRPAPKPLTPAFFCWETSLDIPREAFILMDSMACKKLYIKILDIGLDPVSREIAPYSRTPIPDAIQQSDLQIIPCIFITNEVFQQITDDKIEWLAGKIGAQIKGSQLLIDCDWTPSTRVAFFNFLEKMRSKLPASSTLIATIRLHQYKFPRQTGVPPVDRGMLMFYNTGDVDTESERNSIFHPEDAQKYLENAPRNYPLALDLALPLFSWGLVFREGELWKIVPGPLPLETMRQSGKWKELPIAETFEAGLWEVKEGTFLGGHYLRPGDHLRFSAISPDMLLKIAAMARKLDLADDANLAFFHLNLTSSGHFSAQLLDSVCNIIRN